MTSSTGTDAAVETAATPIPAYLALYLSSNSPPRFAGAAFSWRSGKGAPATLWAENSQRVRTVQGLWSGRSDSSNRNRATSFRLLDHNSWIERNEEANHTRLLASAEAVFA